MKKIARVLALIVVGQLIATEPPARPDDPIELIAMREAWQRNKRDAALALDRQYRTALETSKARYQKAGDREAVEAIERELAKFQANTLTGSRALPLEAAAPKSGQALMLPKQRISPQTRRKIEAILEGKIWRVDHGGEGLRWYYFAKDGKFARKSKLTDWVWSDLDGTWRIDHFGTVIATGVGNTAQITIADDGTPKIALNRAGILTVRPLYATELEYPGVGKD